MLIITIEDDEGRKELVPFVRSEITIGREEGNTVQLKERNVSRRHARLSRDEMNVTLEDLSSYNGIRVNGERISGQVSLAAGDLVQIGDYELTLEYKNERLSSPRETIDSSSLVPVTMLNETPTLPGIDSTPTAVVERQLPSQEDPIITDRQETPDFAFANIPETDVRAGQRVSTARPSAKSNWIFAVLGVVVSIGGIVGLMHGFATEEAPPAIPIVTTEVPRKIDASVQAPSVEQGSVEEKLSGARAAINRRQWDKARDILESCLNTQGQLAPEASSLLSQMATETTLKKNIDLAEKALNAKDFAAAKKYLDESSKTQLLAALHLELTARWEDEQPPPPKQPLTPAEIASKQYDEGVSLFKRDKLTDAKSKFEGCLKSDATFFACHKALGGVHAKLGNTDKGFFHYKQFLKLAPNDKDAPKVQAIVDDYEKSKNGESGD